MDSNKSKLAWIVNLRWLVVLFLSLVIVTSFVTNFFTPNVLGVFLGFILFLIGFNFFTSRLWLKTERSVNQIFLAYQLTVDIVILTAFLVLSGGIRNPFYIFVYLNLSLGAVLLQNWRNFVFLIICHQALFIVQVVGYLNPEHAYPVADFVIQHFILFVTWVLSSSLGLLLNNQQIKLSNTQVFAEKMDRLRALGALMAGFSHEFASPLNTIKLRIDRELRRNPESSNLIELKNAVKECEQVIQKINQSQLDPREYRFSETDITRFIQEVIDIWRVENTQAFIELYVLVKTSCIINLPKINLSQALINIFDNAYEASAEGQIAVYIFEKEGMAQIKVANQGSQFSEEILKRFGEPFVTTKENGTGLGLYSVQLFSQSIGGKARIYNENRMAVVEIDIPKSNS
ncbi:MAG: sensor histidine kinase [Pseudobdellovibrio sp.]